MSAQERKKINMEEFKNRKGANARVNMVLGAVYQVAIVAIVAVIVFADIAVASDSTKRLVAFIAIMTSVTSWIFTSNALLVFQNDSKDMTAAEKATALGSSEVKQPWLVYQIYVLALTVATIVFIVTSIY
jgi:glucan phosphoethanolaminetransferase (alkaline phosphatase superfamily)